MYAFPGAKSNQAGKVLRVSVLRVSEVDLAKFLQLWATWSKDSGVVDALNAAA
jgi:hypothetical protein